ncbi:WG repeat-containing protein [Alistipes putredinis]|uniref:WG repeat-containing protein n=1 Tax=Alistipes putredinis TaxID=28117 RepID=UPI003AB18A9D
MQPTPFGTTWVGEGEDFASRACTLLDVSGKPLIDYKVYQVNPSGKFGHASAAVPDSTGLLRFGVLDGRGRVIVPFEYDDITIFSEWDSAAAAYVERGIAEVKGQKYPFALRRGE